MVRLRSSNGDAIWAYSSSSDSATTVTGIDLDRRDNIYITGSFFSTSGLRFGSTFLNSTTYLGGPSKYRLPLIYVIRFPSNATGGQPDWGVLAGGDGYAHSYGIAVERYEIFFFPLRSCSW